MDYLAVFKYAMDNNTSAIDSCRKLGISIHDFNRWCGQNGMPDDYRQYQKRRNNIMNRDRKRATKLEKIKAEEDTKEKCPCGNDACKLVGKMCSVGYINWGRSLAGLPPLGRESRFDAVYTYKFGFGARMAT